MRDGVKDVSTDRIFQRSRARNIASDSARSGTNESLKRNNRKKGEPESRIGSRGIRISSPSSLSAPHRNGKGFPGKGIERSSPLAIELRIRRPNEARCRGDWEMSGNS